MVRTRRGMAGAARTASGGPGCPRQARDRPGLAEQRPELERVPAAAAADHQWPLPVEHEILVRGHRVQAGLRGQPGRVQARQAVAHVLRRLRLQHRVDLERAVPRIHRAAEDVRGDLHPGGAAGGRYRVPAQPGRCPLDQRRPPGGRVPRREVPDLLHRGRQRRDLGERARQQALRPGAGRDHRDPRGDLARRSAQQHPVALGLDVEHRGSGADLGAVAVGHRCSAATVRPARHTPESGWNSIRSPGRAPIPGNRSRTWASVSQECATPHSASARAQSAAPGPASSPPVRTSSSSPASAASAAHASLARTAIST